MEEMSLNRPSAKQSGLPISQSSNLPSSNETTSLSRLVIAAPQGRSGKTTVTLGLCAALTERGLAVQPFKKGPDYIDPSWLSEAAGRTCRTLDPFFLISQEEVQRAFLRGASRADVSLIEGNHGLYDSLDDDGTGSTAVVARWLQAPVILVVNTARMSRSVAALVQGYQTFEPDTHIAAVILNNVGHSTPDGGDSTLSGTHSRHERKLRSAIERHCHIPVVGAIPRSDRLTIPDRHIGLVPRAEDDALIPAVEACRRAVEQHVDLDAVLSIARAAPPLPITGYGLRISDFRSAVSNSQSPAPDPQSKIVIGVIRDRAFTFYYPENLEALVEAGAELVFIDALCDTSLPNLDALYIGGGFPEMFMQELSTNRRLRLDVRSAARNGLPIYAECGGLMYLARRIIWGGRSAEMVGVLPCDVEMTDRPQGHGYVLAESVDGNPFLATGTTIRGHEFHNSRLVNWQGDLPTGYHLVRGNGLGGGHDGLVYRNVLASYTHLHAAGSPGWAEGLVARARAHPGDATSAA
jgi:cobyrinic acid a,c-diamide synthase